ncbi:citramalate synthase [Halorubraceae archaeon YAN]|nr:citramalate synthase [Halorubraceae archaeon YAN]
MALCDVTLREGDQLPGRSYSVEQKVDAGLKLDQLGIQYLQPGFPITGEKDQTVIKELAANADAEIIGLARALEGDVDAAVDAESDVVEIFGSFAKRYLDNALESDKDTMKEMLRTAVDRAHERGTAVHLTLADAFRTDIAELQSVIPMFADVDCLVLADTVGVRTPRSVRETLTALSDTITTDRLGVHFHDDMGVATANALVAYELGVHRIDASIASFGERAGNPALEEIITCLAVEYGDELSIETEKLIPTCRSVLAELGESIDDRKAILGDAVVTHESGIHTAAMLTDPSTFEPFDPATFGGERRLLFGAGTGRSAARKLLERANIEPTVDRICTYRDALTEQGPLETKRAVKLATELFETGKNQAN